MTFCTGFESKIALVLKSANFNLRACIVCPKQSIPFASNSCSFILIMKLALGRNYSKVHTCDICSSAFCGNSVYCYDIRIRTEIWTVLMVHSWLFKLCLALCAVQQRFCKPEELMMQCEGSPFAICTTDLDLSISTTIIWCGEHMHPKWTNESVHQSLINDVWKYGTVMVFSLQ